MFSVSTLPLLYFYFTSTYPLHSFYYYSTCYLLSLCYRKSFIQRAIPVMFPGWEQNVP